MFFCTALVYSSVSLLWLLTGVPWKLLKSPDACLGLNLRLKVNILGWKLALGFFKCSLCDSNVWSALVHEVPGFIRYKDHVELFKTCTDS